MNLHTVKRDFGELAYFKTGQGPYLLGLSGFGCTHYNYIDLIDELKKQFTVILIDNRGTGKSSKTKEAYSIADLAKDALSVMDAEGAKSFGLMGISMGGFIAQELCVLAPERVRALSLMCTTGGPPHFSHGQKLTEDGLRAFDAFDPLVQAQYATMGTVHPTLPTKNPSQFQRIINLRMEHKVSLDELIRQNNAAVAFIEKETNYDSFTMPVLAMCGREDRFVSPESPNIFKNALKNASVQTEWIDETDHFFFLERPSLVAEKLTTFFKGKI